MGVSSFYFLPYKQVTNDMEKAILSCCWTVYERKRACLVVVCANSTGVSCDMLLLLPDNKGLREEDQDLIIPLHSGPYIQVLLSLWLQLLGYHTPFGTLLYK